jgi:hypothetical protein
VKGLLRKGSNRRGYRLIPTPRDGALSTIDAVRRHSLDSLGCGSLKDLACYVEKRAGSGSLLRGFSRLFGVKGDITTADAWKPRGCFADPEELPPLPFNASSISGYYWKVT